MTSRSPASRCAAAGSAAALLVVTERPRGWRRSY